MVDTRWSSRQIAFGGFAIGFFFDLFLQTFVFDEPFGTFLFVQSSVMGVVCGLVFFFGYHRATKEQTQ